MISLTTDSVVKREPDSDDEIMEDEGVPTSLRNKSKVFLGNTNGGALPSPSLPRSSVPPPLPVMSPEKGRKSSNPLPPSVPTISSGGGGVVSRTPNDTTIAPRKSDLSGQSSIQSQGRKSSAESGIALTPTSLTEGGGSKAVFPHDKFFSGSEN